VPRLGAWMVLKQSALSGQRNLDTIMTLTSTPYIGKKLSRAFWGILGVLLLGATPTPMR